MDSTFDWFTGEAETLKTHTALQLSLAMRKGAKCVQQFDFLSFCIFLIRCFLFLFYNSKNSFHLLFFFSLCFLSSFLYSPFFSILISSSPPLSYSLLSPLPSLLILIYKVRLNALCVFSIWSKNHFKREKNNDK